MLRELAMYPEKKNAIEKELKEWIELVDIMEHDLSKKTKVHHVIIEEH